MQQTNNSRIIADKSRQGIALVMVLGVLTILTLLAVSFAVTMRTERLAAENYVYVVKARHFLNEALARAIFEADESMVNGNQFYPDFYDPTVPLTNAFVSLGGGEGPKDLLSGEVESFIPLGVWDEAVNASDRYVEWNNIEDPSTGDVIGRFAYLVLNCSGLLDANYAGGQDRGVGTNVAEIAIEQMSDVSDKTLFLTKRDEWVRFETLPELLELAGNGLSDTFENMFIFSRFPVSTNLIYIGGSDADLQAKEAVIKQAFSDCGISDTDGLFKNLIDYVDSDSEPKDLNSFCTELVPMINEVLVTGAVTRTAMTTWTLDLRIEVETWFPFRGAGPNFRLSANPAVSFPIAAPSWLKPDASTLSSPAPVSGYPEYSFQTSVYHFDNVSYTTSAVPGTKHGFQMQLGSLSLEALGAGIVDRIPDLPKFTFQLGDINAIPVGSFKNISAAKAVADPRINWDATHWLDEAPSIGAVNPSAIGVGEGISPMFVRDAPLQSVAELGFLSIGEPWRTVTLCKTNASVQLHPVLDRFAVDTNLVRKGLANPNTRSKDVLAAALYHAPVDEYPGEADPALEPITWPEAQEYATYILDYTQNKAITNLAQIGEIVDLYLPVTKALNSDAQREAIIRNNVGLLSPRQNLFTIILAAQVTDGGGSNPAVFAEQRAVAVVWRDPVADDSGKHPCFVRFFKLLAD